MIEITKRKYVKKEKISDEVPIDKSMFDALLRVGTKIKPPKKDKQ